MSKYPRKIRVKVQWSAAGIERHRSAMGPAAAVPKYRWVVVNNEHEEKYARGTPMTVEERADLDMRRAEYYRQRNENT